MQFSKSCIYVCLMSLLLVGCSKGGSIVPKSIQERRISFYTAVSSGCEAQVFLGKSIVYFFDDEMKYIARSEGKVVDEGQYSYHPISGSNSANLILTYKSEANKTYEYTQRMDFSHSSSGKWHVIKTTDPGSTMRDRGTFKILE